LHRKSKIHALIVSKLSDIFNEFYSKTEDPPRISCEKAAIFIAETGIKITNSEYNKPFTNQVLQYCRRYLEWLKRTL
jgi:hypothetical protein